MGDVWIDYPQGVFRRLPQLQLCPAVLGPCGLPAGTQASPASLRGPSHTRTCVSIVPFIVMCFRGFITLASRFVLASRRRIRYCLIPFVDVSVGVVR